MVLVYVGKKNLRYSGPMGGPQLFPLILTVGVMTWALSQGPTAVDSHGILTRQWFDRTLTSWWALFFQQTLMALAITVDWLKLTSWFLHSLCNERFLPSWNASPEKFPLQNGWRQALYESSLRTEKDRNTKLPGNTGEVHGMSLNVDTIYLFSSSAIL